MFTKSVVADAPTKLKIRHKTDYDKYTDKQQVRAPRKGLKAIKCMSFSLRNKVNSACDVSNHGG